MITDSRLRDIRDVTERIAARLLDNREDREDAVQDAMVKVLCAASDHPDAGDGYLIRVAANSVVDRFRRNKRVPPPLSLDAQVDVHDRVMAFIDLIESDYLSYTPDIVGEIDARAEALAAVRAAKAAGGGEFAAIAVMVGYGYTSREIAHVLGIPSAATARSRISRFRAKVRAM